MKRRFPPAAVRTGFAALAAAVLVAACGYDSRTPPPPHEITDATVSVLDGMSLKDYPGPKAQIVYADGEPDFFCDTLGLFSVYLRPEHDRKVRALYVQDMGATGWRHPVGHWIDAKRAIYVIGSKKLGAMGQTFASFAAEADAARFAKAEGGKLYRFDEITPDMATTDGGVVKDQTM
ncbi:nitrous oxide reductase accessory protein NosL [Burkholderia thailandensis]|uniref:NosL family protein n=1 Tax=Burkholderia thailandensis TaxID=57975 RepID=A0AAW9CWG5_BURTH|nr:nitrous oxide reductase accessory protein NosL [Burkholderia thailandensis]AHI65678.1 nosL family protein [Burkholderia thailandensis H0587]AIP61660.1 NosL [Burkholderia thailandensis]AJY27946.1 nosL family protein [Burkholderia thailandensis 34]AOI51885.1 nitrous oxide reductase accessory protein NosL [Burkholderia thailandensis]AOJ50892.1 nitrous oxide reductase accessory protein NosL [Burkholderia thailandensis]